jgi:hypothetical protein
MARLALQEMLIVALFWYVMIGVERALKTRQLVLRRVSSLRSTSAHQAFYLFFLAYSATLPAKFFKETINRLVCLGDGRVQCLQQFIAQSHEGDVC